jgi:hypothetical protein
MLPVVSCGSAVQHGDAVGQALPRGKSLVDQPI